MNFNKSVYAHLFFYIAIIFSIKSMDLGHQNTHSQTKTVVSPKCNNVQFLDVPDYDAIQNIKSNSALKPDFESPFAHIPTQDLPTLDDILGKKYTPDIELTPEALAHIKKGNPTFPKPCGILLFGAPGREKALAIEALKRLSGWEMVYISGSNFLTKIQEGNEQYIDQLFKSITPENPTIIYIDKIDKICKPSSDITCFKDRVVVNAFKTHFYEIEHKPYVFFACSTNHIERLDPSFKSRFSIIEIKTLGATLRQDFLTKALKKHGFPVLRNNKCQKYIAHLSDSLNNQDIDYIAQYAAIAYKRNQNANDNFMAMLRECNWFNENNCEDDPLQSKAQALLLQVYFMARNQIKNNATLSFDDKA